MARYIDADALIEKIDQAQTELETNNPVVWENNRKHWWGLVMARAMTDEQPAADVMTKEEAGFCIEQARQEVAMEIFEELRRYIINHCYLADDDVDAIWKHIDKLEKKYTEEKK